MALKIYAEACTIRVGRVWPRPVEIIPATHSAFRCTPHCGHTNPHVLFPLKGYLTDDQVSHLLRIDRRCNLLAVRSIQSTEYAHMNNIQVIERVAKGVLAVTATVVSVLVFQFAMLAG
jgi:hypothetical protein